MNDTIDYTKALSKVLMMMHPKFGPQAVAMYNESPRKLMDSLIKEFPYFCGKNGITFQIHVNYSKVDEFHMTEPSKFRDMIDWAHRRLSYYGSEGVPTASVSDRDENLKINAFRIGSN
jgi:hypothetical protein